jgi:cytoskeletal protein CcmA (bactofilin family)
MSQPAESATRRVSLLGPKSVLSGDFTTTEELVVLGQVLGARLQAPSITIGPSGQVTANIYTDTIRIEGTVTGNVYAKVAITLGASANVSGSINCPNVTIREGANVNEVDDLIDDVQLLAAKSAL